MDFQNIENLEDDFETCKKKKDVNINKSEKKFDKNRFLLRFLTVA